MRLRKLWIPLVAVLGAAVAVVPSMSSSAATPTATVTGTDSLMWSPMEVSINTGGTVTFVDESKTIPHGVVWQSGPETPACSGVPINEGKTNWKGTCTFAHAGTYHYYCFIHGMHMSGTIQVGEPGGGTTTTTTTTTPTTTTTTTTHMSTSTTTTPGTTTMSMPMPGGSTSGGGQGEGGASASPDLVPGHAGAKDTLSDSVLRLGPAQHGSVHGALEVAQAGSRLEVELLVAGNLLGGRSQVAVLAGRLIDAHLQAGRLTFTVPLGARARKALRHRGRLSFTVRLVLTPPAGAAITRTLKLALASRQ